MTPLDLTCTAALIQARLREQLFFLLVLHVIQVVMATDMSFGTQEVLTCMEGVSDYIIDTVITIAFLCPFLVYTLVLLVPIRSITLDSTVKDRAVSYTYFFLI